VKCAWIERHRQPWPVSWPARRGEYGWPRIWRDLLARGIRGGTECVRKLMKLHGIKARGKRKFKAITDSNHMLPVAENLLERQFTRGCPEFCVRGIA
jgi:putative transposase